MYTNGNVITMTMKSLFLLLITFLDNGAWAFLLRTPESSSPFPCTTTKWKSLKTAVTFGGEKTQPQHKLKQNDTNRREISPYYRRDRFDDSTLPEDLLGLQLLLERRYHARIDNDAEAVSRIDRDLKRKYAVRAFDHPPIWTRRKEPPLAHLRRIHAKQVQQLEDRFGTLGHPYRQVGKEINPLFCALSLSEIQKLLLNREICRVRGDLETADAILFELWVHGIRVHEDYKQWTSDPLHRFTPKEITSTVLPYKLKDITPTVTKQQERRIQQRISQLVDRRAKVLTRGNNTEASFIAFELNQVYNVTVDDKCKVYSIGTSDQKAILEGEEIDKPRIFPPILYLDRNDNNYHSPNYRQSSMSLPLLDRRIARRVHDLVLERVHRREEGQFLEADAIRRELWHAYNVGVNDRLRQFSVGGIYDNEQNQS